MAKSEKTSKKADNLVSGYLERISSRIFSEFPKDLTALAGKQHGVYALYKGERLYYVGLATDLHRRINHHMRDRHAGKWNKFSLYLVRKADHIKELESLILRIADPKGNATKGKFRKARNLSGELRIKIRKAQDEQIKNLMGARRTSKRTAVTKPRLKSSASSAAAPLAKYVKKPMKLIANYRGQQLTATVRKDGRVFYNGKIYNSPSAAACKAAEKGQYNGWRFWKYKNADGHWVPLRDLRQ